MDLNKKNIVLIGMMGSGKSTIGHLLSKTIDLKFVDIDKVIEKETGLKIHSIFEKRGEVYFRNLEEKITLNLLKEEKKILSLGVGAFLNNNIRKEISENNLSFWLSWKSSTLIKRIYKNRKRPLAFDLSKNDLRKLITKRSKIYSEANYRINCESLSKSMIVKKIINLYEKD